MKATQFVVLLCAGIASAARCKPTLPASSSASSTGSSSASAVVGPSSSSAAPSSAVASASAVSSSASSFGSSGSLSPSLSASVSASVSASAASFTPSSASSASASSSASSSASAVSSSSATPSAVCGGTNLFGDASNMATNGASWNPQGTAGFFSDSCETTTNQCLEVQGTSNTANTFTFGYFLPTTAGTAYTLTFDFAVLSGALSKPFTCTVAGGTTVNLSPALTAGAGVYKVQTIEFTGAAGQTTTNFFCSGSSTTAFEIAFNNFFYATSASC
ncbi:hypothetical protein SBRCBS47491_004882 [Sporothrix bragantina]|uniref:Uncharacterized protein n=1 Tax=Sporothrix bragantina TaxID=671064 RepID=A0ABP0BS59_9PEZI